MASVLGGSNNVEDKDYRLNYYWYAIADHKNKKDPNKPGATWTWSSNARKTIGYRKSGQLDKYIDSYFENLSPTTTINGLIEKFEKTEDKAFTTRKNSLVIFALQKLIECL